jgi:transcription elongation factor Elf1
MANFFTIWCEQCNNEIEIPYDLVNFDETVYVTCGKCKAENTFEFSSNDLWKEIDNATLHDLRTQGYE